MDLKFKIMPVTCKIQVFHISIVESLYKARDGVQINLPLFLNFSFLKNISNEIYCW